MSNEHYDLITPGFNNLSADEKDRFYQRSFGFLFKEFNPQKYRSLDKLSELQRQLFNDFDAHWQINTIQSNLNIRVKSYYHAAKAQANKTFYRAINDYLNTFSVLNRFGISAGLSPWAELQNTLNNLRFTQTTANILDVMSILGSPFSTIWSEWVSISKAGKKNDTLVNKIIRSIEMMWPLMIAGVVLFVGYELLLPLASHVLLEYILFLPALYISFAIAALFIEAKNSIVLELTQYFFSGIHNTPHFESNTRIESAFTYNNLATKVAKYYSDALNECSKVENYIKSLDGALIDADFQLQRRYDDRKNSLNAEWKIMRDSEDTSICQLPGLFQQRLNQDKIHYLEELEILSRIIKKEWTGFMNDPLSANHKTMKDNFEEFKTKLSLIKELDGELLAFMNLKADAVNQTKETRGYYPGIFQGISEELNRYITPKQTIQDIGQTVYFTRGI